MVSLGIIWYRQIITNVIPVSSQYGVDGFVSVCVWYHLDADSGNFQKTLVLSIDVWAAHASENT